jgi:hypothetical protein
MLPRNPTSMLHGAAGEGNGDGDTHNHFTINTVDTDGRRRLIHRYGHLFAAADKDNFRRRR